MSRPYRGPHFKKIRRLGALPGLTNKKEITNKKLRLAKKKKKNGNIIDIVILFEYLKKSNNEYLKKSNKEYLKKSNNEYLKKSNKEYLKKSNTEYLKKSNTEYLKKSNKEYKNNNY